MSSATLRHFAKPDRGILVHFGCSAHVPVTLADGFHTELHTLRRHYGWTLPAADALERWGAGTTLADLERRAVCSICGARRPKARVSIHVPTSGSASPSPGQARNWG
ncbi:MAG: hypothetical protein ACRDQZ_20520 [Mycobacteriales bacterium]